jgi:hypothetical protein
VHGTYIIFRPEVNREIGIFTSIIFDAICFMPYKLKKKDGMQETQLSKSAKQNEMYC